MGRGVNIEAQKEEKGQVTGIKSLVEVDGLNVDENIKYLGGAQSHAQRAANQRLILRQEEAAQVFQAIAVATSNTLYIIKYPCNQARLRSDWVSIRALYNMCRLLQLLLKARYAPEERNSNKALKHSPCV